MVQVVPSRAGFGTRFGAALGGALSESIPKEIDRYRLSSGLKQLEQESPNLTPMQFLTRAISIPGLTPQAIQSLGELAQKQAQGQALGMGIKGGAPQPTKEERPSFPIQPSIQTTEKTAPTITTRTPLEATISPYIPKTYDQIVSRAGELYNSNPALYKNDPQAAVQAAIQEDSQLQAQNQALQSQRLSERGVQDTIKSDLRNQAENLGVELPGNVYSDIEDKAINSVLPKSQGGEGLTPEEASKKMGKELDKISRDYKAIETVGTMKLLTRSSEGNKASLRSLRNKFKERDDLENFADSMTANNSLSPSKSYYLAYPVSDVKDLNNAIVKYPDYSLKGKLPKGEKGYSKRQENLKNETLKISEKLAPLLGKEGSPLSVAEEIKAKGYDPYVWLDYLDKNRKKLNLGERQGRELDKPRNFKPTMNDLWMFYFSGLDKLVEQ